VFSDNYSVFKVVYITYVFVQVHNLYSFNSLQRTFKNTSQKCVIFAIVRCLDSWLNSSMLNKLRCCFHSLV